MAVLSSTLDASTVVKALAVMAKTMARTGSKNLDFKVFMINNI
tara:strand:+ start:613 stop:741 length:129 start_codon:yes stop_codon:yes gene_type:complete